MNMPDKVHFICRDILSCQDLHYFADFHGIPWPSNESIQDFRLKLETFILKHRDLDLFLEEFEPYLYSGKIR
jgi:hypothetical protein